MVEAVAGGIWKATVCHVPRASPVSPTSPRETLLSPNVGLFTSICTSPYEDGLAWFVGSWMSSSTIGLTPPIELMAALFSRTEPCSVTSNEKAPCVRLGFMPTTLPPEAKLQSASASNPRMSEIVPDTGQVPLDPLQTGAGEPAPQVVPAGAKVSVGHAAEVPEQVSATSHKLSAGRQTVPAAASASAGQTADVPVHVSAASQPPAAGWQTVVAGAKPSAGQTDEVPVQNSAASQVPVEARQSVVVA